MYGQYVVAIGTKKHFIQILSPHLPTSKKRQRKVLRKFGLLPRPLSGTSRFCYSQWMHALVRIGLRCRHPLSRTGTRRLSHVATTEHDVRARCVHLINHHHHSVSTMSSSEGENFDLDNISGSESDGYAPVKKKTVNRIRISWSNLFIQVITDQSASKEDNSKGETCL